MRIFSILFLSLLMISCNSGGDSNSKEVGADSDSTNEIPADSRTSEKSQTSQQADSTNWISDFRSFRNAVYLNDRAKVKQFFDFPIMDAKNEIWQLAYNGDHIGPDLSSDKMKPFTEADFDKYYDKIFPTMFIKSILKIKSEELNKKGEFETIGLTDGHTSYKTYATVDKQENTLELNLACNTPVKAIDGTEHEVEDPGEYNVIYYFDILNNTRIKFRRIRIAG